MKEIIGRAREIAFLDEIWSSKQAEFVAVYGRRRVGKTHLIREFFGKSGNYFELAGLKDGDLKEQLYNFSQCFTKCFYPNLSLQPPKSWRNAFELLTSEIQKLTPKNKVIIFLDELPWLATKRSKLIQHLDYIWNTEWSKLTNLKLIVCGSAASWMLDNLINAKGGLYNRITNSLLLQPFELSQTKAFLQSNHVKFNHKQILDIYMVTGGIPHYLKQIKKSKSAIQNIDDICFKRDGLLFSEFDRLFQSLFEKAELHMQIIREVAKTRYGVSIQTLSDSLQKKTGGTFTKYLNELAAAGFIQAYYPIGRKARDKFYRVIDEYTYFYLSWIEPYKVTKMLDEKTGYWQFAAQSPAWKSWAGYAFEMICFKHIHKIRKTLNITNIHCQIGNWRMLPVKNTIETTGAQIDLVMIRDDGVVNLCDMKYLNKQLIVDKALARNLMNKIALYEKSFPSLQQLSVIIITTVGIKKNAWSEELIDAVVVLDDLF